MSNSLQFVIREEKGQFCLFTKDGKRKLGCHETRDDAVAQEAAIEAQKSAIEIMLADLNEEDRPWEFFDPEDDDKGPSRTFLNALREHLKNLFKKKGSITDKDFSDAVKRARSVAGGKMNARKRKRTGEETWFEEPTELYALAASELNDGTLVRREYALLNPLTFAQVADGQWVPYLPIPGSYESTRYGTIVITKERNKRFVDNFTNGIYQRKLPIDAEHETKVSGAMAWIVAMRQNADGSVDAQVTWTDRGRSMMAGDRFKFFSPEYFDEWTDPATGDVHRDVAIGGALTTRPFFKEKVLRPLVASETGLDAYEDEQLTDTFKRKPKEDDSMAPNDNDKGKKTFAKRLSEILAFGEDKKLDDDQLKALREVIAKEDEEALAAKKREDAEKKAALDQKNKQASERIEAIETDNKKLREDLEASQIVTKRLNDDARRQRFSEIVEGRTKDSENPWFGKADDNVARLGKLADAVGEDSALFKDFLQREIAASNQMAYSAVLQEAGYAGVSDEPDSVEGKVAEQARKLFTEQPDKFPTIEQARTHVWEAHPEWKAEHHKMGVGRRLDMSKQ